MKNINEMREITRNAQAEAKAKADAEAEKYSALN